MNTNEQTTLERNDDMRLMTVVEAADYLTRPGFDDCLCYWVTTSEAVVV